MEDKDSRRLGDALTKAISQLNTTQLLLIEIQMELDRLRLIKPVLPPQN